MSEDFFSDRDSLFLESVSKMYRSFNRAGSPATFKGKAGDLSETLSRLDDSDIIPFFQHVVRTEDSLPHDKRLIQICYNWKAGELVPSAEFGHYDPQGSWVPKETFQHLCVMNFENVITHLKGHEIDLLVKAQMGLVEPGDPEVVKLQERRFYWPRGKYQIPRGKWGREQNEELDRVMELTQKKIDYAEQLYQKYSNQGVPA